MLLTHQSVLEVSYFPFSHIGLGFSSRYVCMNFWILDGNEMHDLLAVRSYLKVYLYRMKAEVKFFFHVCHLYFDIVCFFFLIYLACTPAFTWCRQTLNLLLFFYDLFHFRPLCLSLPRRMIFWLKSNALWRSFLNATLTLPPFQRKACRFPVKLCLFYPTFGAEEA